MVLIVLLSENIFKLFSTNFKKNYHRSKICLTFEVEKQFRGLISYVDVESMLNLLSINGFPNHILVI